MPTLDGIEIHEICDVSCLQHGKIGTALWYEGASVMQRQHYERRHQPSPAGRICLWRYPAGSGYRLCQVGRRAA